MSIPRILHIDTGRAFRGGQRQLILLAQRLAARGISQVIACPRESALSRRLDDLPIVPLSRHSLARKLILRPLKQALRRHDITVIHAHDGEAHTLGILLKKSHPDLKLVVTRRVIFPPSGAVSRRLKYRRHVDRYIAISRAVARSLTDAGVDEASITVIPSGLDLERISRTGADSTLRAGMPETCTRLVVTAGALTREKDFVTAVRAVALTGQKLPGIGLLILGEGPEKSRLAREITRLKLAEVRLMGHREPVAPIFKACDLFLLTSTSEGLNSSAIEAAACGLPLVVSDVGGLPEIVEHQYNGMLCPPGAPEAFAEAIVAVLADEGRRRKMSAHAVSVAGRFDIAQVAEKVAAVYNCALAD